MTLDPIQWLLDSDKPWTRYRTLIDIHERSPDDPEVTAARVEMLEHPQVQELVAETENWPGYALKRHNDAKHPLYKFSTLADFGLHAGDPGMDAGIEAVLNHQSSEGAYQTMVNIPKAFGGTGVDSWTWVLCDSPTLLYALIAMGLGEDSSVKRAVHHLASLVDENGWRCVADTELGRFKGPGRKTHPCPIANVYALKALAQVPDQLDTPATRIGTEMLLSHWEHRGEYKYFLFGIGTDFRKLKYPFVWYDILHVADVLSRFPFVHIDPRFQEMIAAITQQADDDGRYTATSMYRAWKGWSFADKKNPSPWITFLVMRIHKRING
jgi:hypothetical protein